VRAARSPCGRPAVALAPSRRAAALRAEQSSPATLLRRSPCARWSRLVVRAELIVECRRVSGGGRQRGRGSPRAKRPSVAEFEKRVLGVDSSTSRRAVCVRPATRGARTSLSPCPAARVHDHSILLLRWRDRSARRAAARRELRHARYSRDDGAARPFDHARGI